MRHYLITATLLSALGLASPCLAADYFDDEAKSDRYFSGSLGLSRLNDSLYKEAGAVYGFNVQYDLGYEGSLAWGGNLGERFRLEGELSYSANGVDDDVRPSSLYGDGDNLVSSVALMANCFLDFPTDIALSSHLMVGLGMAHIDLDAYDDLQSVALQLGGGVSYEVSDSLIVDLQYRYFVGLNLDNDLGEYEFHRHRYMIGLRFPY